MKLKEEEIKEHAIKFAKYVSENEIVYDDFIFMSTDDQEEIYKEYLKSKK